MGFFETLNALGVAVGVLAFAGVLAIRGLSNLGRLPVLMLAALWIVLWSVEYWVLGDRSYIHYNTMNAGFSSHLLYSTFDFGQIFSHRPAGGIDLPAASQIAGGNFSLEQVLVRSFAPWIANALHQAMVVAVAVGGMYRCCRAWPGGCDRTVALALGALFSLSQIEIYESSWNHGLGYAALPMLAYFILCRSGRRLYWTGVLAASAVAALSCSPTHSELAVAMGLLAATIMFDPGRFWRFLPAGSVHILLQVAVWHENLYAKYLVAPYSLRGTLERAVGGVYDESLLPYLLCAAGVTAALAIRRRVPWAAAVAVMLTLALWLGVVWTVRSTEALATFRSVNFARMSIAFPFVASIVFVAGWQAASTALARITPLPRFPSLDVRRLGVAVLVAASVGQLVWYKAYNASVWLSSGGMAPFSRLAADLAERPWESGMPSRAASLPYRISDFALAYLGIDTVGGTVNIIPTPFSAYWDHILAPYRSDAKSGYLRLRRADMDFLCCEAYRISDFADLQLLRIANVEFVYSFLPLTGDGIVQIAGPTGPRALPRSSLPYAQRIPAYAEQIRHHDGVRVYSIGQPVPRVFAARHLHVVDATADDEAFYRAVRDAAPKEEAVVRADRLPAASGAAREFEAPAKIVAYRLTADGFDVELAGGVPGVIVFNQAYTPFWEAAVDGRRTPVFPVNAVHMAAFIGADTKQLTLRYRRPTLK